MLFSISGFDAANTLILRRLPAVKTRIENNQEGAIMQADGLLIKEKHDIDLHHISAIGDLIITNAQVLQRFIDQALKEGAQNITLDFSKIHYIDSFGIGVVVKTKSEVDKKKGRFRVVVNPTLQNLFQKCHLDEYIDLLSTEDENGTEN
jgi:anti-anti-sigma factor